MGRNKIPIRKRWLKKIWRKTLANAVNVLYEKEIFSSPAYISKHNWNHKKQIILFMISYREDWHYLAVKKLLRALLRAITSKCNGDFLCLNCLYSFRTKNNLKSHENVCKNKDFCEIVMSSQKYSTN